jgi:hypothetical protein
MMKKLAAQCEKFSQIIFVITLSLSASLQKWFHQIEFVWKAICGNKQKLSVAAGQREFDGKALKAWSNWCECSIFNENIGT